MSSWNTSDHLLTSSRLARIIKENLPLHEQCVAVGPQIAAGCNRDKKMQHKTEANSYSRQVIGEARRIMPLIQISLLHTLVHMLIRPLGYSENFIQTSLKSLVNVHALHILMFLSSKLSIFIWTSPMLRVSMA